MNSPHDRVRAAAFRALLATGRPVSAADLAVGLGTGAAEVEVAQESLDQRGQLRRDDEGRVVGSCGLSVVPSRHELKTGGRRFWTWCAYDAVGILGALHADGTVRSISAATGRPLEVTFRLGSPETDSIVVVMPDASGCDNPVEDWCPQVNFIEDEQNGSIMAKLEGAGGRGRAHRGSVTARRVRLGHPDRDGAGQAFAYPSFLKAAARSALDPITLPPELSMGPGSAGQLASGP